MVITDSLNEEWNEHRSRFAQQWRVQMVARKKVVRVEAPADEDFREQVAGTAARKREQAAIRKDMHLVEAAFASDQRIVALDEAIRALLNQAARSVGTLRTLLWVNPSCEEESPVAWLENRARMDKHRLLGAADT